MDGNRGNRERRRHGPDMDSHMDSREKPPMSGEEWTEDGRLISTSWRTICRTCGVECCLAGRRWQHWDGLLRDHRPVEGEEVWARRSLLGPPGRREAAQQRDEAIGRARRMREQREAGM